MGRAGEKERLFFIDNLRILLIVIVILVHLAGFCICFVGTNPLCCNYHNIIGIFP